MGQGKENRNKNKGKLLMECFGNFLSLWTYLHTKRISRIVTKWTTCFRLLGHFYIGWVTSVNTSDSLRLILLN